MEDVLQLKYIVGSVVYTFLGMLILIISFIIVEKITPQNIWLELIDKRNTAIAIVAGAYVIAIAIIIASAIH
ncbi:MAG: DUF350 domain-containing protein [Candidatus Kapabacteria bacterium]|nr:DUF350 domain-containing protein [Candidatus Kapabacteria bacterium]MBX7154103.1 DUF350 domain-containing protein [Bacteroidota bacterium]